MDVRSAGVAGWEAEVVLNGVHLGKINLTVTLLLSDLPFNIQRDVVE